MKNFSLALTIVFLSAFAQAQECVRLYYDQANSEYWIGRTYAVFAQNLLGHFPELQQIIAPIETYKKGDIETCRATIYISSYFDNKIPDDFFADFENTKKNVAWLGYNIWKMPGFSRIFGYKYSHLTALSTDKLDFQLKPTYFKWIDYKGERFFKFGEWSKTDSTKFVCPFEMAALAPENDVMDLAKIGTEVLATSKHNGTNEEIPYAIRNKNHFYFADVPFSFMHEADRYLIYADVLFDILNLPPRHKKKMAVIRMEDIHPIMPVQLLYLFSNTMKKHQVPLVVSIIPFFFDPLKLYDRKSNQEYVAAFQVPEFVAWLKEIQSNGAKFIWHGVTHQFGRVRNPHDGISGADFEFWNAVTNTPVVKDTVPWVLNRLYDGYAQLKKVGVEPKIWLTPHYQSSTLDNYIFSRVFPWNIGRVIYFNFDFINKPVPHNSAYHFTDLDIEKQKKRIKDLSETQINVTSTRWNGQMFPYEIYGDVHGQRLLPENLGNSQPFENSHVIRPRSVQEMVADAKRNRVIRDAWASFFYHPFLFEKYNSGGRGTYSGDPSELDYLITEIKSLGYEFVDIEDFAVKNQHLMRKEPIYIQSGELK